MEIDYKIGDCLELMQELPDNSVNLVIADPPYNIGKDSWDKIDDYVGWMSKVFCECERVLKDNGSFYFFHNDFLQIVQLQNWINENTGFIFRQMITWNKRFRGSKNKGYLDGYIEVEGLRNYQQMAEYCIYYTFNIQFPQYLKSEFTQAGVSRQEIAALFPSKTGNLTGCVRNWLLGNNIPTKEQYLTMRDYLNGEYLRQEYEDLRYTYNNQKTHHSVWNYDIESLEGHITPKPVELIKNIIIHSSNEGDLILDPFLGSGTTLRACRETNRKGIGFEKDKKYEPIIRKRIMVDIPSLDKWGIQ